MAYDARGQVVLFGGYGDSPLSPWTWTWDGTDWTQHLAGSIELHPRLGPPGTEVHVHALGFAAGERVRLVFVDSTQGRIFLEAVVADVNGAFTTRVTIPPNATQGSQWVKASGTTSGEVTRRRFTVT
jgi:hypothetical protein